MFRHRRTFIDMRTGIVHQLLHRDLCPGAQLDIGAGQFARHRIGLSDRSHDHHRRMPGQRLFDRGQVDIMPTPDDEILRPPGDEQITVRIQPPQIAGPQIEPLGIKRLFGFMRVIAVSFEPLHPDYS